MQQIFSDHLENGKWANASPELRQKTCGLPKHNKFSESVFGHLDRLMREKPNITTIASEAFIMFSHNKTSEWLETKSPTDKDKLLAAARKSVKSARREFKARQLAIQEARRLAVAEKLQQAEALRLRRLQKREKQTSDIIFWGLWQSEEQVTNSLLTITSIGDKVKALKAQLHFRQNILQQKPSDPALKDVYAMSKVGETGRRISLRYQELAENVCRLIRHSYSLDAVMPRDEAPDVPLLVGKRVGHRFLVQGREIWYRGKVISQVGWLHESRMIVMLAKFTDNYNCANQKHDLQDDSPSTAIIL